ncbi:P-loop containing nucleoside triphosphate hydrolase protein [Rhypophila decipiens]|uniref:Origin recognition complex subunit 1 n=1 Tax=Rhypophila decipiens TaxID=261697 RepID=A0AAN6Y2G6_9PEZI|nr:P-loop containing nucleoside triphosphate hydrolase protein [Rhypophila decipiens]
MPGLIGSRSKRTARRLPGVTREDSDDELGTNDYPWEWIYDREKNTDPDSETVDENGPASRKRKRAALQALQQPTIVGARMGEFECYLGEIMLLKAEGSHEAWVGIITEFLDDEEGDKAATFMWFSSEREIRNSEKKRKDFVEHELYITANTDINPLTTINGKAHVMSQKAFNRKYPNGKVPKKAKEYGKTFICRRGCNARTCTYTEEFIWEDVYHGKDDIDALRDRIVTQTQATRRRQTTKKPSPEGDYTGGHDDDDDTYTAVPRTPKKLKTREATTPGSRRKTPGKGPATPSSHRKIMIKKHLEFTPLATRFLAPQDVQSSPYQIARNQLHVASVPTSLPCRESEFSLVYSHLEAAITEGTGTCIYISGTPGTGKTATVREVVSHLDSAVKNDELDDFIFVEINGMKITDPHQSYSLLWEALKGQRVSPSQALDLLEREFSHPSPRRVPCVVLMDELDQLVTKNQGVMYNFFNWPGLRHSRLIVLAVANTMDLPERTLSNKISSRLGLTRITFPGYNHEQLMRIVQSRLEGVPGDIVDSDAVQFAARKVAAVSGDARRALDICRRAVELAEVDSKQTLSDPANPPTPSKRGRGRKTVMNTPTKKKSSAAAGRVTIDTIRRAINEATSNPLQLYLRALPFASRLLLTSILNRTTRSGLAETTFGEVLEEMQRSLKLADASRPLTLLLTDPGKDDNAATNGNINGNADGTMTIVNPGRYTKYDSGGSGMLRPAGLSLAAVDLAGAGIMYLEGQKAERPSKIRLAVSDDEVRLAFRDDPEIKALGILV